MILFWFFLLWFWFICFYFFFQVFIVLQRVIWISFVARRILLFSIFCLLCFLFILFILRFPLTEHFLHFSKFFCATANVCSLVLRDWIRYLINALTFCCTIFKIFGQINVVSIWKEFIEIILKWTSIQLVSTLLIICIFHVTYLYFTLF